MGFKDSEPIWCQCFMQLSWIVKFEDIWSYAFVMWCFQLLIWGVINFMQEWHWRLNMDSVEEHQEFLIYIRPLTANLRWRPFSSVPHVSDRLELHDNNRASWILHPGPSENDVYSDVVQEAQWNDLLHTARLLMRLDTPLHGNNARGAIVRGVLRERSNAHSVRKYKMAALRAMSEEKCCSPFPCFFIPCLYGCHVNWLIALAPHILFFLRELGAPYLAKNDYPFRLTLIFFFFDWNFHPPPPSIFVLSFTSILTTFTPIKNLKKKSCRLSWRQSIRIPGLYIYVYCLLCVLCVGKIVPLMHYK